MGGRGSSAPARGACQPTCLDRRLLPLSRVCRRLISFSPPGWRLPAASQKWPNSTLWRFMGRAACSKSTCSRTMNRGEIHHRDTESQSYKRSVLILSASVPLWWKPGSWRGSWRDARRYGRQLCGSLDAKRAGSGTMNVAAAGPAKWASPCDADEFLRDYSR